jgi:hypothetical protein
LFVNSSGQIFVGQSAALSNVSGQRLELTDDIVINTSATGTGTEAGLNFYHLVSTSTATRAGARIASISTGAYTAGVSGSNDADLAIQTSLNGTLSERLRITSTGTLMHLGAGNSTTPAVQFNGSAPVNSLVMDSSGRVGLGTSSPSNILHVSGTAGTPAVFELTSTTGTFIALKDSASQTFIGNTNGVFSIQTPGSSYSDKLVVTSAGAVGIGSTAPADKLSVAGSSATDFRALTLRNSDGTTGSAAVLTFEASSGTEGSTASIASQIKGVRDGLGTNGGLEFWTSNAGTPYQRARIDSSGRLLVGTSSSISTIGGFTPSIQVAGTGALAASSVGRYVASPNGPGFVFQKSRSGTIGSHTVLVSGDTVGNLTFEGSDGSNFQKCAEIQAQVDGTPGANDMPGRLVFSTTADGASIPTERMRINSAGTVGIGIGATNIALAQSGVPASFWLSATGTTSNPPAEFYGNATTTRHHIVFSNGNGVVGSISTNASATAYNTSSDYRLKENVVPLTGAADRLKLIPVHRFNFIADPDNTVDGFIAHEAQVVVPECVTGIKDEVDADGNPVYQGIDQSKLVPLLTAALQEALAEIESLKARVTALEP